MNRQNRNRQNEQERDEEQQQQPRQRNRIQGPTSALSSFLREHGIHIENRSRRRRRQDEHEERQQQQATENAITSDNNNTTTSGESISASSSTTNTPEPASTTATTSILYAPRQRRRQLNAEATQLIEAAQAASSSGSCIATKKKGKRKKSSDSGSDSDYEGSETDDEPGSSSNPRRPFRERRNEIVFCDKCKGRFARPVNSGNDIETENICPPCTLGESPNKKRKRTPAKRRVNGLALGQHKVPSLQDICIMVVARYIDDVEAFGEIGPVNLDKLSKIISKNRKLTSHTARLFMEPTSRDLALYDCTNIDETGLSNIAHFCAQLKSLRLIYCGQMTSNVLDIYRTHLKSLQGIELSGPYLVTKDAWINFFKMVGKRLEVFKLAHSFRFNRECLEALVIHCPNLKELEFSRLNMMQDDWMEIIQNLKHLKTLKLAWPDPKRPKITSESLVSFLSSSGKGLVKVSFAGLTSVDDQVLLDGLLENCPKLKILNLQGCKGITSEGIQKLFNEWNRFLQNNEENDGHDDNNNNSIPNIQKRRKKEQGLIRLNISRILDLDDDALKAILMHSSKTLEKLNLHSLDKISARGLEMIAGKYSSDTDPNMGDIKACEKLKILNCGFIRSMDDLVLKLLIEKCALLERINVWGCNQLTNQITTGKTYIVGRELEFARQ